MKRVIVLFTPKHTGTHFVRMLLESHPAISTAIGEDYRIDSAFRAGHVLCGLGAGWVDPPLDGTRDRGSERMLLEYFRDFLLGASDRDAFVRALAYWQTITSEKKQPLSHYERHLRNVQEEFRSLGIELAPKRETHLLYRGHCHGEHQRYDLSRLTREFSVVVTVRHPLRSILTTLRRNPMQNHAAMIDDYVKALQCSFTVEDAFFFCTDLWQSQPQRMAEVFAFLDLPSCAAAEQFLARPPRVNYTVAPDEDHGKHNYCMAFSHPPEILRSLDEARVLLDAGRLHPVLAPYWSMVKQAGLLDHYERLGYSRRSLDLD